MYVWVHVVWCVCSQVRLLFRDGDVPPGIRGNVEWRFLYIIFLSCFRCYLSFRSNTLWRVDKSHTRDRNRFTVYASNACVAVYAHCATGAAVWYLGSSLSKTLWIVTIQYIVYIIPLDRSPFVVDVLRGIYLNAVVSSRTEYNNIRQWWAPNVLFRWTLIWNIMETYLFARKTDLKMFLH